MATDKLSLLAVGDLVPSRRLFAQGQQGVENGFGETVAVIQGADIAFGDLEMPLSTKGYPREKLIAFRAPPEIAPDLQQCGFDVLSLANNHSLDYSYDALFETMAGLDAQHIRHVGAGSNLSIARAPVILEMNSWRVGFIAWSCLLPTGAAASEERPGLAPIHVHSAYEANPFQEMEEPGSPPRVRSHVDEHEQMLAIKQLRELRQHVDFLAVSIHWGYGAGEELAEYQQPLGHAFIDAGADVVLGNHVHAIHGVEIYQGKAILYSPGNFIAQQPREGASDIALAIYDEMSPDGYMARLDINPDGGYQLSLIPTATNAEGLPEIVRGSSFTRIADRIQRLSRKLGTTVEVRGDEIVVPISASANYV